MDDDEKLWDHVTKDIEPLKNKERLKGITDPAEEKSPSKPPKKIRKAKTARTAQTSTKDVKPKPHRHDDKAGIDRRNWERFVKGKMPFDGRLDLHGMRQDEAHDAVKDFIKRHYALKSRALIIITGKGRGILRDSLKRWLEIDGLGHKILKIVPAQQKDGGSGAFYLLLKRKR
jgi:DNA-nicking Smr family endonuclease